MVLDEIRVVIPTGRLSGDAIRLLDQAGYKWEELGSSRQLSFYDSDNHAWLFLAKPGDVATYVEHGVADVGIIGKDTLLEEPRNVLEVMDLGFGKCRIVLAKPMCMKLGLLTGMRVATKYPTITARYLAGKGIHAEIIKVNGSVELAPRAGLADVVVDLVSTGQTLAENELVIVEEIASTTARLIVNQSSYHLKTRRIHALTADIAKIIARGE